MEQYNVTHKYIIVTTTREYIEIEAETAPNIGDTVTGYNELEVLITGVVKEVTDEISVLAECALLPESKLMAMF